MIKPQFEAGREKVGKKGVVREKSTHIEVIDTVSQMAISEGFRILDLDFSPIKGPEGNIEYLIYLEKMNEKLEGEPTVEEAREFIEKNSVLANYGNSYDEYYRIIKNTVEESHSLDK